MLLMMYRCRSAAVHHHMGNLGYNAHRDTHAEGVVWFTRLWLVYTGCAGRTFILTGVGEVFYSTAGCALVAPGIIRYKAHGMSHPKRGVRANPSNPPWLHPCCAILLLVAFVFSFFGDTCTFSVQVCTRTCVCACICKLSDNPYFISLSHVTSSILTSLKFWKSPRRNAIT